MLCVIDEFTRENLAIRVARKLKATDVIDALVDLFILRDISTHIRFDNIPEFVRRHFWNGSLTSELKPPTSLGYRPPAPEVVTWPKTKPVAPMPALN
jgi:hypothetical protein